MLTRFADFDTTLSVWDEVRRRMDRVWDDFDSPGEHRSHAAAWPRITAFDAGSSLLLRADVPGMNESDFTITLTGSALTVAGERKSVTPQGYTAQRLERPFAKFSRTWSLPYKVDAEKTTATVKDGILSITLAKVPEAQPRQITVRASA